MNARFERSRISRRALLETGALTVGFALASPLGLRPAAAQAAGRILDKTEVDAFLAVNGDATVTMYSGKVDLGTGLASRSGRSSPRSSAFRSSASS